MAVIVENNRTLYQVVVQDQTSWRVLMVAYADDEALRLTRSTGLAHFFSRSRQALWKKGETSGHVLPVAEILADCDQDTYLYLADAIHPVCHLNRPSCFPDVAASPRDPLARLSEIVSRRLADASPDTSYTAQLALGPLQHLLKKVGEEAIEVLLAAVEHDRTAGPEVNKNDLVWETVDLLYHLSVLLHRSGISLAALSGEIERRHRPDLDTKPGTLHNT
ncbi:MAG: bifunctional phosphoribosyl-AMP cyclohydrolase/phosphoribosyl-ATP diphosphatase HisIE [Thermaerobacter sp.]|nr:bifunctional phosphoribosyl-AMP cyclohydrolase/phosphoribosyl-ATP diphosphatase HisIE [Thermaerobacter sp.]